MINNTFPSLSWFSCQATVPSDHSLCSELCNFTGMTNCFMYDGELKIHNYLTWWSVPQFSVVAAASDNFQSRSWGGGGGAGGHTPRHLEPSSKNKNKHRVEPQSTKKKPKIKPSKETYGCVPHFSLSHLSSACAAEVSPRDKAFATAICCRCRCCPNLQCVCYVSDIQLVEHYWAWKSCTTFCLNYNWKAQWK